MYFKPNDHVHGHVHKNHFPFLSPEMFFVKRVHNSIQFFSQTRQHLMCHSHFLRIPGTFAHLNNLYQFYRKRIKFEL
jgi:hypothetical protein